ncbi:MAG: neuraminidase-like domain-containing protein [Myxococcota bacterium]
MKWFSDATTIHPLTPVGSTPSPEQTLEWFERLERFRAMGFSVEQLSWLLSSTPKARQNLAPRSSDVQASLGRLRDAISNVEDAVQHPGLVQKQLAVDFNLTSEVMGALESLVFTSLGNQTITAVLTDSAFVNSGSTSEVNDADPWADLVDDGSAPAIGLAFNAYELLAKIVNLLVTLGVDAEGLRLWVNSQAPLALLDLTTLPLSEDLTAVATRTEQLWNTARLFTAGARMPGQSPSVVELVTAAQQGSASEVYAGFAQRIDRPEHDIRDLIAHFFGAVDVRVMLSSFDPAQRTYSLSIDGGDAISATKASDWASAPEMWAALKTAIDVAMGGSPVVSVSYIDAEGGGVSGANAAGLLLSPVGDYHAEVSSTDFNRLWDIYDVERLEKLFDAIGYLTRVPVSATELIRWRTLDPDASVSEAVRSAAQVGSDTPEDWASISKPAQDHIRIAKRDASTAWLLGHIPYKYGSIADLHGYYLIDPAMSPCMKTTRLKQAISSVQLFIFRVMAGLEDHLQMGPIRFGEEAAEAWAWRKSYRVWEAARKVFLYPENWIEPELRKNKTTFFERFESEVLESEFTEEGMENAFLNYLEEVHNVSNLRIIGMYHEYSAGEKDVLHLFGQTRSTPKRNWYRRREDGLWTPWEEVPLDLPKPQAAPVIFADRLILFWMEARKEKDKDNSYWKVNLAWSEYQDGIWSPKRISEVSLDVKIFSVRIVQDTYFYLKTKTLHSGLYVHVFTRSNFKGTWERFRGSFWLNPCTGGAEVISADNEKTLSQEQPGPGSNYIDMSYFYQGYRITQADFASIPWAMVETGKDYIDGVTPSVRVKNLVKPITISLIDEPNPPPRSVVIMTPNQYTGFVSQSPFIVQEPEHTYLAYDMFAWRDTGILDVYFGDSPSLLGKSTLMAKDGISEEVMPISSPASLSGPGSLQRFMGTNDEEQAEVYGARLDADFRGVNQLVEDPTGFASQNVKYRFETLHHHYICDILREARFHGVMGVLSPDPDGAGAHLIRQAASNDSYLSSVYFIEDVIPSSPRHDIDFDYHGPQGAYNWEIFFHVPYYIACRLSGEQQFEEAMRWFHTIFDPRRGTEEAWRVKPLVESSQFAIDAWKSLVDGNGDEETRTRFVRQVQAWEKDPFDPHAIAQLRPLAYKRSVLMKYLDTILAWGDERFTQDTMESLNEATQLYLYAFSILGERSVSVTHHPTERDTAKTFDNIAGDTTTYTEIAFSTELDFPSVFSEFSLPISHLGDFCVPRNAAFEKYWDIIEDRLYKIRHCLNIQGVRRTLPIFEPEIDPAELIRASAFGADLDSVVGNDDVLPVYRFSTMLQTAKGLAGSVRAFSSALLSALEKKDAEEIARLRSQHEVELLEMVRDTRQQQVEEAERSLAAAERSKAMAVYREAYYAELLEEKLLPAEKKEENQREKAVRFQKKSSNRQLAASVFRALPTFGVGAVPEFFYGGQHIGGALDFLAAASSRQALEHSTKADRNARRAGRQRREQEWNFQVELAKREQAQLEQSIQAAQKRVEIAQRELSNHDKQIAQRREVDDWMRSKFTSQELYAWMVGQLSALHSQSYQLAIEIARKAERCYRHELGIDVEASGADSFTPFVKPGRWDSLRKGLMAGEWLQHELDRMEVAYLDNNIREYELTKHISLSRLDPFALALLRENGECWIEIPEVLFDLDCPGQYFRRISSVAVTVACVSGAQRHINVELELTSAKIRTSASGSLVSDKIVGTNKIVTSAAIEDPGMFSADGGDGRFRPFERRGAVSTWHIRIANQTLPQFDWNSISDVTMHMRYTARDGGDSFRDEVSNGVGGVGGLKEALDGFTKGITAVDASGQPTGSLSSDILAEVCATRDAPDAWHMAQTDTVLSIPFGEERRPYFAVNQAISIKAVYLIVKADDITSVNMSLVEGMSDAMSLVYSTPDSSVDVWKVDKTSTSWPESVALTLSSGNWSSIKDAVVIVEFTLS